jgi:hypothetical protein
MIDSMRSRSRSTRRCSPAKPRGRLGAHDRVSMMCARVLGEDSAAAIAGSQSTSSSTRCDHHHPSSLRREPCRRAFWAMPEELRRFSVEGTRLNRRRIDEMVGRLRMQRAIDRGSCRCRAGVPAFPAEGRRAIELRSGIRRARLWSSQGKSSDAAALLETRYRRFEEGFHTADLMFAGENLAELRRRVTVLDRRADGSDPGDNGV